jgi:hypothetical protein
MAWYAQLSGDTSGKGEAKAGEEMAAAAKSAEIVLEIIW